MTNQLLIYGANGYTGRLITELAVQWGMKPILAGRNAQVIRAMAESNQLPYRVAALEDPAALNTVLQEVAVVIHAAGPFSVTARPMMEACLRNKVHYLDITGEIGIFEMAASLGHLAAEAGIMIMPGTGFDVVPTDCMALRLKTALPDASQLELAFTSTGGAVSHGTATTMAMSLGEGGAIRSNGKILRSALGAFQRHIDFGKGPRFFISIPWGDVSTAFHTTGIPNIITYTAVPPKMRLFLQLQRVLNPLLRTKTVRNWVQQKINRRPAGPTTEMRNRNRSFIWGQAKNDTGKSVTLKMSCLDGYSLTAFSSLLIAQKVLGGNFKPGFRTPAGCYGAELIKEIPGTEDL